MIKLHNFCYADFHLSLALLLSFLDVLVNTLLKEKRHFFDLFQIHTIKITLISVTGDTLTLSGERKLPEESENASYHRREREAGSFSRVISLPTRLDVAKVKALAEDGVLTVVLPKAESAKPRQIAVKSS